MSKSKLQTALDDFVTTIVDIAEDTAQDTLAARAKALGSVKHTGRKPMAIRAAGTAKKSMTKPCPVLKCKSNGAPRHGMMCSKHKDLPKDEKNALRFKAKEPGGKWSSEPAPVKAAKRTKRAAKKAASSTKKNGVAKKAAKKASAKAASVQVRKKGSKTTKSAVA